MCKDVDREIAKYIDIDSSDDEIYECVESFRNEYRLAFMEYVSEYEQ